MTFNWWFLTLGLILRLVSALFGFLLGSIGMFTEIVIPAVVMFEIFCPPERADALMDSMMKYDPEEGKKIARLFYIFYRMGYVFRKDDRTMPYYLSAIDDSSGPSRLLRVFEKRQKEHVED